MRFGAKNLVSSTPSCPVTNYIEFVNAVVSSPQNALCFPVATQNLFKVQAQYTPSRSALMTGRLSIRSGTYEVPIGGVADAFDVVKVTLAELLSGNDVDLQW